MIDALALTAIVYSVQVLCLIALAAAAVAVVRLPSPAGRLGYWRGVGALCIVLPFLPPLHADAPSASAAIRTLAAGAAVTDAVAPSVRVANLLAWTWAAGVLLSIARIAAGGFRLRQMRRRSTPLVLSPELESLRSTVAPNADLRWSDEVTQPVTFGLRQPVILLPPSYRTLDPEAQRAVACHELLHVARRDWVWIVMEEHARALGWFHPGVWWLLEQVQLSREQLIDQLVVARTAARRTYMHALLAFADARPAVMPAIGFLRTRHLKSRIRQLSKEVRMSRIAIAWTTAVLMTVLGGAVGVIASTLPLGVRQDAAKPQDDGVTQPVVIYEVKPEYTAAALEAKIEGMVLMEVVVLSDGTVGDVAVIRSLDKEYGLDEQAVRAAKQWRFKPGTRKGKPAAVLVTLEMRFALK